jgi:hypothetical protein
MGRLAKHSGIRDDDACVCAASIPILDGGMSHVKFTCDMGVTGSIPAASPPLRGRRKPFRKPSLPQDVERLDSLAARPKPPP